MHAEKTDAADPFGEKAFEGDDDDDDDALDGEEQGDSVRRSRCFFHFLSTISLFVCSSDLFLLYSILSFLMRSRLFVCPSLRLCLFALRLVQLPCHFFVLFEHLLLLQVLLCR